MTTNPANPLPRWRGFNLLEKFSAHNPSKTAPNSNTNAPFREEDFQWISDWGFDFMRLPMSYCCWSGPNRWRELDEPVLEQIDQAVEFGRHYGIHVCLNFHRAPGYCVPPMAPEPFNLWKDQEPLEAFCHHWETFARRYRGIGSDRLSFNLVTDSLGSFDHDGAQALQDAFKMPEMDFQQVHRYLDQGAPLAICRGDTVALGVDAVQRARRPDRPVLLAETSAVNDCHSGPFRYYGADHDGLIFHDTAGRNDVCLLCPSPTGRHE